jgi:Mg-chelatase subunit ChlD
MSHKRRVITASLLCLAISASARGQADSCQQRSVAVSVVDERGEPVHGLAASDFSAKLKGKQVTILSARLDERPHRVVVVLDSSASMFDTEFQWSMAKSLATEALAASPARFRAGLIVFNDQIRLSLPVQEDTQAARDALNALPLSPKKSVKTIGRHTALWDALMAATRMLDPPQFGDSINVITDGGDNESSTKPKELRAAFATRGVRLFAEWFGSGVGPLTLEELESTDLFDLVNDSGGLTLQVPFTPLPGEGSPTNYKLNSKQEAQFRRERLFLYSSIQSPYRLEFALPAQPKRLETWNLFVPPPKDLKGRWVVNYPKRLDSCTKAANALR